MRTETINIYSFEELSEEAKQKAIEEIRESYYEDNDFANWAIDYCALLEPKHDELIKLFGKNYNFPLIKNTRKNIYFDTDRNSFLDCNEAMEITNKEQFLKWLGIPKKVSKGEDFSFNIFTPNGRNNSTTIDFDGYSSKYDEVIENAIDKFNDLISEILQRIKSNIAYRFTNKSIVDRIKEGTDEFTEDGEVVRTKKQKI